MRSAAIALAIALVGFVGCGEDPEDSVPQAASVCDIAAGDAPDGQLVAEGEARPIFRLNSGFELLDSGCAVFVASTPSQTTGVEPTDSVAVIGILRGLNEAEAERLDFELGRGPGPGRDPKASVETGDAYLDSFSINEAAPASEGD